ncbi:MAG: hypothetical protein MI794_09060 [Pseudomonadales bacterium]|nr:hypothetical protein [Pseudomonadales bacterium]
MQKRRSRRMAPAVPRPLSKPSLAGVALLLLAGIAQAQPGDADVVTIEGTRIRADQELPTVMYLVPWQPPQVQALKRADEQLMVGTGIAPLERAEFRRLLDYHRRFQAAMAYPEEGAAAPAKQMP